MTTTPIPHTGLTPPAHTGTTPPIRATPTPTPTLHGSLLAGLGPDFKTFEEDIKQHPNLDANAIQDITTDFLSIVNAQDKTDQKFWDGLQDFVGDISFDKSIDPQLRRNILTVSNELFERYKRASDAKEDPQIPRIDVEYLGPQGQYQMITPPVVDRTDAHNIKGAIDKSKTALIDATTILRAPTTTTTSTKKKKKSGIPDKGKVTTRLEEAMTSYLASLKKAKASGDLADEIKRTIKDYEEGLTILKKKISFEDKIKQTENMFKHMEPLYDEIKEAQKMPKFKKIAKALPRAKEPPDARKTQENLKFLYDEISSRITRLGGEKKDAQKKSPIFSETHEYTKLGKHIDVYNDFINHHKEITIDKYVSKADLHKLALLLEKGLGVVVEFNKKGYLNIQNSTKPKNIESFITAMLKDKSITPDGGVLRLIYKPVNLFTNALYGGGYINALNKMQLPYQLQPKPIYWTLK
jgi:hypothetical protein